MNDHTKEDNNMMSKKINSMRRKVVAATVAVGLGAASYMPAATAAEIDFGNVGDPINLVVGYQPYYTEA